MAVMIKCKMCGGDLALTEGSTIATCEYCGTTQTVPSQDNEKKLTLFARANRLRASCEFDKAAGIYESIVTDFPEEAEAYWGLVLCKYGIEYVDDPASGKKIPTCHRSSFDSVMDDENFDQAMENADEAALRVYREEAKQIEKIRKGILEVSSNEQPYDIFICYKETDVKGDRTVDSLLAQDIYDALTDKGYRVFFARITLEDKLGQAYEPYIFAALNSAKIMLAVGTCYEHYNAVWVKNEWSRYLKIIAQDKNKYLIPCYKGIDAYDMPKEFAHLQGQDMGKVGAMQDLLRGVEKILPRQKPETIVQERIVVGGGGNGSALLKRGYMALEDAQWIKAEEFFEEVLNQDAECAEAYVGKVLVLEKCASLKKLGDRRLAASQNAKAVNMNIPKNAEPGMNAARKYRLPGYLEAAAIEKLFEYDKLSYCSYVSGRTQQLEEEKKFWDTNRNLNRAFRFATGELAQELTDTRDRVLKAMEERIQKARENEASDRENTKARYKDFQAAADEKAAKLLEEAKQRKHKHYEELVYTVGSSKDLDELHKTEKALKQLGQYEQSREYLHLCQEKIQVLQAEVDRLAAEAKAKAEAEAAAQAKAKAEAKARAKKKAITIAIIAVIVAAAVLAGVAALNALKTRKAYDAAMELYEAGEYTAAAEAFVALEDYEDSAEMIIQCRYDAAMEQYELGNYDVAEDMFQALEQYAQSEEMLQQITKDKDDAATMAEYMDAMALLEEKRFLLAEYAFADLGDFEDSAEMAREAQYRKWMALWDLAVQFEIYDTPVSVYEDYWEIYPVDERWTWMEDAFEEAWDAAINEILLICPTGKTAEEYTETGYNYESAMPLLDLIQNGMAELGDYKDAATFPDTVNAHFYNLGVERMQADDYAAAIAAFGNAPDYADSQEQIKYCCDIVYGEGLYEQIVDAQVGDTITLGHYEQDGSVGNGAEPIEWIVLDNGEGGILLISKYILDARKFVSSSNGEAFWPSSELRSWLQHDFCDAAFTEQEKLALGSFDLGSGTSTTANLLSSDEYYQYYKTVDLLTQPTAYAQANQGTTVFDGSDTDDVAVWWLRTAGANSYWQSVVDASGNVDGGRKNLYHGVRPIIIIDVSI